MSRPSNERRRGVGLPRLLPLLLASLAVGCALIDLRGFPIASRPSVPNQLLESAPSVWVEFPEPVVTSRVEPLLSVTEAGRPLAGDLGWQGNRLSFTPVTPFTPGALHRLLLKGTVETLAGRSIPVHLDLPFSVGTDSPPPIVTGVEPPDGSVVGRQESLTISFSDSMDPASFHDAFSVSPFARLSERWNDCGTVVQLAPVERWEVERIHTWRLAVGCRARSGAALPRPWSGTFLVQPDVTLPRVLSTAPAAVDGAGFVALPGGLAALRFRDSILITFSEEVDLASLARAISISPTVAGALRRMAPRQYAYVPAEGWLQRREYLLTLSTDLTDPSGNPLASAYREAFTPAIPPQAVTEIAASGDLAAGELVIAPQPVTGGRTAVVLPWIGRSTKPDTELELTLCIRFAEGYEGGSRATVAGSIELAGYLPESLPNPRLLQASWLDERRLLLTYLGFARSSINPLTGTGRLYYRLVIPGGEACSINQAGSVLPSTVEMLFESGSEG